MKMIFFFFRICWCLKFLLWYLLMLSKFENRRGRMFIRLNQNISDAQSCWNFGRSNIAEPDDSSPFSNLTYLLCVQWYLAHGRAKPHCSTRLQSQATCEILFICPWLFNFPQCFKKDVSVVALARDTKPSTN